MKYGQQLERDSVPEWSLHNLDYNSLKHEIKVHTTKDQATAITIPGHPDQSLRKFEDALYFELCRQHDRVDMFVGSKAAEISRRLEHLATSIKRWAAKAYDESTQPSLLKRQRKFAKYQRDLLQCDSDIHALSRFSHAQVIAFQKILKKYKKWTGSTTLSSRINEDVLGNPKSFTRRDFTPLHRQHDAILTDLRTAEPAFSEPSSPDSEALPVTPGDGFDAPTRVSFQPLPPASTAPKIKYWNEYDDGSEAGDAENEYTIFIDPDDDSAFPGMKYVTLPFEKVKKWLSVRRPSETSPLLGAEGSSRGYSSTTAVTDSEEEGYASSDGIPAYGFAAHYAAFPSVEEQRVVRYREKTLLWGAAACFGTSFVLLGICSILISVGKSKLRVEVDAGVILGVMVSLFCSCAGLSMTLYRKDRLSILYTMAVWSSFVASCLLNGMLLIVVVGNTP